MVGLGSDGEGEAFVAESERLPVEEEVGGDDTDCSAEEAEEDSFEGNEGSNLQARETQSLQDGGFLHAGADDEQDGVGDEAEDGRDGAQSEPAGEADELDHLLGSLREEGLLGTSDSGLRIGTERFVDRFGNGIKKIRGGHLDVELGDGSQSDVGGLLEKGEMNVGDIVVLGFLGLDDAGDVDVDSDRFKLVTDFEPSALGEGLPNEGGITALDPVFVGSCYDHEVGVVLAQVLCRDAPEGDHVEAGPAIVDCDLDGDHLAHAFDPTDGGQVVLGEARGCRAEAVLSIDNEGGVVGAGLGDLGEGMLHGLHGREKKHARGDSGHGQERPKPVASDVFQGEDEELHWEGE